MEVRLFEDITQRAQLSQVVFFCFFFTENLDIFDLFLWGGILSSLNHSLLKDYEAEVSNMVQCVMCIMYYLT